MTVLLVFLLLLAIGVMGFLGFQVFQLSARAARLDAELVGQRQQNEKVVKQWTDYGNTLKSQNQGLATKYKVDTKKWSEYATGLKTEIQRLSKWKNIADADVKAAEMLRSAQAASEKARIEADKLISSAQLRASAIQSESAQKIAAELATARESANAVLTEAKEKAKAQKEEAQTILTFATRQATKVVEAADKKAAEIGGNAYSSLKNAALYEQTVKAMKNIIEGYGDQYIIPEQSLLDDLAEDFKHAQAGQELQSARLYVKAMLRNGTAAACDYVEANRRDTAVNFVLDAFNGKVDSILSRAKHDNAGKLEQEIRDGFALVNLHGKAFRDTRITDAFLAARLDELKWGAITQQLALKEREEQRHIKEQAREEAQAAKERERALRDAVKEEETLRKGIEMGREQLEHATGEQKALYEQRLQEMVDKLNQAGERKKRAMSMAQQTKQGHVYILSNYGSLGADVYKIGLTRRWDPLDRVSELGGASVPFGFDVHAMILSENAPALEHQLHKHFMLNQVNKVNHRKEFFRAPLKTIREEVEKFGLTGVKWTMTAEAKEYRESLATDKLIKESSTERDAWVKRQQRMEQATYDNAVPAGAFADEE